MAKLTGLFQRGSIYYVRVVLPIKHPLRAIYKSGKVVTSIGELKRKEAEIIGMIKRAEILGHSSLQTSPNSPKSNVNHIYLRDVYRRWKEAKPRSRDSINACGRALKLYEEFTNNPPIIDLTRIQGDSFRSWLQEPSRKTANKTAKDRLTWIKSLLKYAHIELELIPRSPWEKLDIATKTTHRRRPWSESELKILFSQNIFTEYDLPKDKKSGEDAAYWIPLLGIYTGARLSEIAQLTIDDIEINLNIASICISDSGEGQHVKTMAGIRRIPIHTELIRLGFLEYVQDTINAKHLSLWPLLPKRKEKVGGYFSNWFGEYRRTLDINKDLDFHCFRHLVRSQLAKNNTPEPTIDALLGHQISGSIGAKIYTHRSLEDLNNAIQQIRYASLCMSKIYTRKDL